MGGPGHDLKDDTDAPTSDEFCCVSLCWTEEWRGSFFLDCFGPGFLARTMKFRQTDWRKHSVCRVGESIFSTANEFGELCGL